jgi:hypothetical protein
MENQIKSKERVADFGEVYTNEREVKAMVDLVKGESERIDSRFLEPACGSGNFLVEVLTRKLKIIENKYFKNQIEFERYSFIAITSLYGIDILEDNANECRSNLFKLYESVYKDLYPKNYNNEFLKSIAFILKKNIIHGDALTLMRVDGSNLPIIFSEWSSFNGSMLKRRDFTLHELLENAPFEGETLFSDLHEEVFIPKPIREYPIVHYLKVGDVND